jgi:hypothetical protein
MSCPSERTFGVERAIEDESIRAAHAD